MLRVRWEASIKVPEGELVPEPFDGELRAGLLLGMDPGPAAAKQIRVESYGEDDDLARLVAAAICHAYERGYLPAALGNAARMSPGAAAYVLRGQPEE